ncbi:tRNA (adenosine(37)-N6)-threonylcarbamoyltransferase complex ATPase subunit type 1 TsaE [Deinococcus sp.]|uniref:tRNA (adenosine(37)-N6)-threonylcarbamoyltransferase complex ATPase subunit type 1 TsaE n=1 Tax=Deinococcus sp. TaxID=47478 RepID=UPI0025B82277|nr:tRNA (adenosine(37)-N6)-threonylcarbamoyltransferase complex ATPase subunit type 1 TsaE [Deinococcus sp.]
MILTPGETRRLYGLEQQQQLGAEFARVVPAGSVLFLEGELGVGKTSFTQGLVEAYGFDGGVNSPTYALMHVYPARDGQVLHVDAYRVRDPDELYEMDLEALIESSRASVIEWGEGLYADYPDAPILKFEHVPGAPEVRQVTRLR